MIFYLDGTIETELEKRELSEQEELFFHSLMVAVRYGQCYLCGHRGSLECLREYFLGFDENCWGNILNKYAQHGALLEAVEKLVVFTFDAEASVDTWPECLKDAPAGKCIVVPLEQVIAGEFDGHGYLLTENKHDGEFYQLIAQHYLGAHKIRGVNTRFRYVSGGGNTTAEELEGCVKQNRALTLCVVDSDQKYGRTKKFPTPTRGETLHRVQQVSRGMAKEGNWPPHTVYPIAVHEVENLIPISVLKMLIEKVPEMREGVEFLEKLKTVKQGEPILYYDFKNGFPYLKKEPQRAYWEEIWVEHLGGKQTDMPPEERNSDAHTPFPPVMKQKLLERSMDYIAENLDSLTLDKYLQPQWEQLGRVLFSWGCAGERMCC